MRILFTLLFVFASLCAAQAQQIVEENNPNELHTAEDSGTVVDTTQPDVEAEAIAEQRIISEANFEKAMVIADERALEQGIISPNEARKMRGFTSDITFVPRGQWIFGGTASYSLHNNSGFDIVVINDVDSQGYTVNVAPMIAYAPWKNMAVGVRFVYGRSLLDIDNLDLGIGDAETGVNINVDMYHKIKHSYTGSIFWRPYIPLGTTNRFALFAEVQLNLSGGQAKNVAATSEVDGLQDYRGTYSKTFGASLGLQPGIVAFITNNAAVELSIGVLGIGFDRTLQNKNQVAQGAINALDTKFKLNLLSVGFGMSFYL